MRDPKKLGTMEHVRSPAYRAHMQATIEKGICPLCELDSTKNVVIKQNRHWRIWKNPFAYPHHEHHLVIASRRHLTDFSQLTGEMGAQLISIAQWAVREFKISGGALVMRFGDPEKSASTLRHLHAHIQVPDGSGPAFAVFCGKDFVGKAGD
jgi:diadenosine tetraphosphate (Ap4A) HIT family hydrolase